MHENVLKNVDILALQKEYGAFKSSGGNYRCRKCLMVDGYREDEKKCRWCGNALYEMDRTNLAS
ncbi:MAG: hypothetical protein N2606_06165 [Candidatus Omnitrophica bacterium]|nr:hypothetical protein [Candidatus Omnitrophota bacterium]